MLQIKGIWGDHTYFLAVNGLNIVEPLDRRDSGMVTGAVINLASWTDETATTLQPHDPEATEVVVEFEAEGPSDEMPDLMH